MFISTTQQFFCVDSSGGDGIAEKRKDKRIADLGIWCLSISRAHFARRPRGCVPDRRHGAQKST